MPDEIDWAAIEGEIAGAAGQADKRFAERISSLCRLTDAEVADLFPEQRDKEELVRLMRIVRSAAEGNDEKAKLVGDISNVAGAVLKLLVKFA